ncbi:3-deoxy-7-phosphoheptulonate synthase class II [Verrucomicrobiaceae bacterium 5K15]|uniref:Phospho-2-dehydro-3-deoxyheptonate aldolase n=1 Tax=Oceaniferula flava TaxID=2800421 RepID=A0AAE2S8R3_9BACT|nr:3-deoxy-7-phosphoheptulonate synthase class II [Oceaniferula flavus]MBK1853503.1 3-deoxy-7-phosphoheptulonate synthase class II [Oceaniferula flavus]MBM1134808.1 3-deoxy-7-phosphoheptulonate synthase class II [Oceaniferula flavus]
MSNWNPSSWRQHTALHQPVYPDQDALADVTAQLKQSPPLVFAEEVRSLRDDLGRVERGEGFLLQGGDCAESFAEFSEQNLRDTVKVILQMAVTLTYAGSCPVVKMGRVAGQFAKPRSSPVETRDGVSLPSYLGDSINGIDFTSASRTPDPQRMLRAYQQSVTSINLLRAMATGGFASLQNIRAWNLESVQATPLAQRYGAMTDQIHQALDFMHACGVPLEAFSSLQGTALYISHEALLLEFEEVMAREVDGCWYDLSGHCLWVGERTRQPGSAHLEFIRGVENPVGVKIGPTASVDDCLNLCQQLNPDNQSGKLLFICRMGVEQTQQVLPQLLGSVKQAGHKVVWVCDPMHGNTETASSGYKTRNFDRIMAELEAFFAAHREAGTYPGGLHLEMTGRYVTECTGGAYAIREEDLHHCYETQCDPRLNAGQALEIAYRAADELRRFRQR